MHLYGWAEIEPLIFLKTRETENKFWSKVMNAPGLDRGSRRRRRAQAGAPSPAHRRRGCTRRGTPPRPPGHPATTWAARPVRARRRHGEGEALGQRGSEPKRWPRGGEAEPGWIRRGSTRAAAISRRGRPEPAARRRRAPLPWGIRRGNLAAVGLETSGQYSSSRAGLPPSCMGRTFYVGYMGPTKLSRIVIPVHVRPKKNPAYVRPNCAPTRRHHAALRCRNDASSLPPISRIQSNDTVGLRCGDARRRLCRRRRRTKTARKPPSMHLAGASAGAWARLERRWRRLDEGVAVALTCTGAEYELCSSRKYWFYSFKKWFSNCPQAYVKFTATHFN